MSKACEHPPRSRQRGPSRAAETWRGLVCLGMLAVIPAASARQVDGPGSPDDVAAIRAAAAAYRKAMAAGDSDAVRAAWTDDGDIVDGWGDRLRPKDEGVIDAARGEPRPFFRVAETALRFVTADVAIEDGEVDVVLPGTNRPVEGWFSAIWVRRGKAWKLAAVREAEQPAESVEADLGDLDWLVGSWNLEPGDAADGLDPLPPMEMTIRWDAARTFLVRDVRVGGPPTTSDDPAPLEIHQRIGWDQRLRRIRSWSFSSDGSHGEATWFRDGDSWVARQSVITADGRQEAMVHISTPDGPDRIVWRMMPEDFDPDDAGPTRATWVRRTKEEGR